MAADGDGGDSASGEAFVDVVGVVGATIPFTQMVVFFVAGVGHGIEEHLEAGEAADVLGWAAPFALDEARIFDVGFTGADRLGRDGVPPVVPMS